MLGTWEVVAILAIALLLFGPKKLPELARGIGKAIYEYRKASSGLFEEEDVEKKRKKAAEEEREALVKAAKKLGIETEGKSTEEIAKEIAQKLEEKGKVAETSGD